MKKTITTLGTPVAITTVYVMACFFLLYFSHNIIVTLVSLTFSSVLLLWVLFRFFKKNAPGSAFNYEEYDDMVDWGIGEYKKTWKKIKNTKPNNLLPGMRETVAE